ncbi:MAG: sulfotransferase family protein [Phormidesmis sp.]
MPPFSQSATAKVFGIGLSRTGTKSLAYALHQMGIHIAHFPDDPVTFQELATGSFRFSILNALDGIADITVSSLYPQLDQYYPGSKFILTTRNKQDWLNSVEKHWAQYPCFNDPSRQKPEDRVHMAMRQLLCATVYGSYVFNRERASYIYDLHHLNVQTYFANRPNDLLLLDICGGDSWQKLCCFLQQPPLSDPFPNAREKTELISLMQTDRAIKSAALV